MSGSVATMKAERRADDELFVHFALGHFVGAIDTTLVERVVPAEEARVSKRGARVGSEPWPALTLASLLELDLRTNAWLLMRLPGIGRAALGVGECLGAKTIDARYPLPPAAFASRAGAVSATFILRRAARDYRVDTFGLIVAVPSLCDAAEWASSPQVLDLAAAGQRREAG